MSDTGALLMEMTERLLVDRMQGAASPSSSNAGWRQPAWDAMVEQGIHLALVEGAQGFGLPVAEGLALVGLFGRHAVPLPVAETMIGNAILARAGLPVVEGPLALVPHGCGIELRANGSGWVAVGEADRIAWGRDARALVVEDRGRIGLVTIGFDVVEAGTNLADMPRDRMAVDGDADVAMSPGFSLLEAGALVRALAMAGALEALVAMTTAHVTDRVQFGRPIAGFQVVQHSLARLAGEAAAAAAAAGLAADAFATSRSHAGVAVAAARARISDATAIATAIAHQLHGAIGFTQEHRLHRFTTALWSWRDEFGTAAWWTRRLGEAALGRTKQDYWPFVTDAA